MGQMVQFFQKINGMKKQIGGRETVTLKEMKEMCQSNAKNVKLFGFRQANHKMTYLRQSEKFKWELNIRCY